MAPSKLLIINPNSSQSMTDALDEMVTNLIQQFPTSTIIHTYTAPAGPTSINNEDDALVSANIVFQDLRQNLDSFDAYLIACYSVHPLVGMLQMAVRPGTHVTGIFEASISTSLSLLPMQGLEAGKNAKFGIVSTGTYWEKALTDGVRRFLNLDEENGRFKGVETTGLTAIELHTQPLEEVRRRMIEATKRLVKDKDVRVVCLGCAGMVGLDAIVEIALIEELGEEEAKRVHVLDGVKAGIGMLENLLRGLPARKKQKLFRESL
jgi:Asp/Glu/hydantoin racemase